MADDTENTELGPVPSAELIAQLEALHGKTGEGVEPLTPPSIQNDFRQIAYGPGAIVESQASWEAEGSILSNGFPTGIVLQTQYNKAWRQATAFIRALGYHCAQLTGQPALDDGNSEKLWRQFYEALLVAPIFIDPTGVNNYVTPYDYTLLWSSPPKDGTQITLWVTYTNTSTSCALNFMGSGSFPIKHIGNILPRIGDITGVVHLFFASGIWYITAINYKMFQNAPSSLRAEDLLAELKNNPALLEELRELLVK